MTGGVAGDNWTTVWDSVVKAIGSPIASGVGAGPVDAIELGAVRRYLEPLEFGCPLHHDREVAEAQGYRDVIAPYTSLLSFCMLPMWAPGDPPIFTDADRDAQPERSVVKPSFAYYFPHFSGYFATDIDIEFRRAVVIGERIGRGESRLASCEPKETRVGRGAFVTTEADIVTSEHEVVARVRTGLFLYTPHGEVG